jgi:hypothetical protein
VEVNSENNCLAHSLVIAKARLDKAPEYNLYHRGCRIRPVLENLLQTIGIDLQYDGSMSELERFQEYFKEYRIVYGGLNCEDIIFDGRVDSEKGKTCCTTMFLNIT